MRVHDANAHIGRWPFRSLPSYDEKSLLREMDRLGIEKAAVCNTAGLFYKNTQAANEELFRRTKSYRDRLVPVMTLNPLYPRALEDLKICLDEFSMRALRLAPTYHGYSLLQPESLDFGHAAAELGVSITIPHRVVDARQHHWMDVQENVAPEQLIAFAESVTGVCIVAAELQFRIETALLKTLRKVPHLVFEISRIYCRPFGAVSKMVAALGSDRLLFGSGMLFKAGEPALLRLAMVEGKKAREDIAFRNFERLFTK